MCYYDSVGGAIGISLDNKAFVTAAAPTGGLASATSLLLVGADTGPTNFMKGRVRRLLTFRHFAARGSRGRSTATIRNTLWNSGTGLLFQSITPTQVASWGMQSWYDFAGPNTLTQDRLNNSNLTNNGGVTTGTGWISDSPYFAGDAITQWNDQTANALNAARPASLATSPAYAPLSISMD